MHAGFDKSMSSTAGDFRNLTPLVLMAALVQASTEVLEPLHRRPRSDDNPLDRVADLRRVQRRTVDPVRA